MNKNWKFVINKKLLSILLTLTMLFSFIPSTVFATETETVYLSVSDDSQYIKDEKGNPVAYIPVTLNELASVDLNSYGLSDYIYDEDGDGVPEITALHLYIYVHEVIMGLDWSDVRVSGGAGSIYFEGGLFGFSDENMRYDLNGAYPEVTPGWGATADQIVLHDGDFINVAHYTSWSFWMDSLAGFHYFSDTLGNLSHTFNISSDQELEVKLVRSSSDFMNGGSVFIHEEGYDIFYGTEYGTVTGITKTDENGNVKIKFPSVGTWYIWADGGYGGDYPGEIVSAPSFATVHVTQDPNIILANKVIAKIDAIGTVTLESKTAIEGARAAYNNLSDEQKKLVSNYDVLTTAELTLSSINVTQDPNIILANEVIAKIDAIGTVTLESKTAIEEARAAYNNLSDEQKKLVSNYDVLATAELTLSNMNQDMKASVETEEKINAIGNVTIHSYNKISAARTAYNALTDSQKNYVKNIKTLIDAETTIASLYEEASKADHKSIYEETGKYISSLGTPNVGSVGGEWMVIALTRAGYDCPEGYYENVVDYVNKNINDKEQLHRSKSTDNSRVILGLTAAGYDVTDVDGHNLLMGLTDITYLKKQGINGPIWALIAFDCHNYEIPINTAANEQATREKLIAYILEKQLADGGWALAGNVADPDMTGMALQSLAPYYNTNTEVKVAVDKALVCLSNKQYDNGGFGSIDGICSESCAQVIVALTALGINPETDARFIKNGVSVVDAMCLFAVENGGFAHIPDGGVNGMATEQSQYALVAYFRFLEGKTSLYDMSDVKINKDIVDVTDKDAANAVEMIISEIGTVTINKENAIKAARTAYDALTDAQKTLVKNYSILLAAEATFANLNKNENVSNPNANNKDEDTNQNLDDNNENSNAQKPGAFDKEDVSDTNANNKDENINQNLDDNNENSNAQKPGAFDKIDSPQTGDNNNMTLSVVILLTSVLCLVATAITNKKRRIS